jgi:hypothetical protein
MALERHDDRPLVTAALALLVLALHFGKLPLLGLLASAAGPSVEARLCLMPGALMYAARLATAALACLMGPG